MEGGNLVIVEEDYSDEEEEVYSIKDKKYRSKARATLPDILVIAQVDNFSCGVIAKSRIRPRTQFGPLDAPLTSESLSSFPLKPRPMAMPDIGEGTKTELYFDTRSENLCNWMSLVRPADNYEEQNLVAQFVKQAVFFTTIRKIEAQEELKVWYAPKYAKFMNKPLLAPVPSQDADLVSLRGRKLFKPTYFADTFRDEEDEVDVRSVPPKKRNWGRNNRVFVKDNVGSTNLEPVRNLSQDNQVLQQSDLPEHATAPPDVLDTAIELIMEVEGEKSTKPTTFSNRPVCCYCGKSFGRKHTLKLHLASHFPPSFLCHACGRAFIRKDKLQEHIKRMHSGGRTGALAKAKKTKPQAKRFQPLIPPTECHKFHYKCVHCMVGFQRRGMLVNHLLKRHPEVNMDNVPELNLPIMKKTVSYVCPYCKKSYQSITKRRDHVLKHHPGQQVPPGLREVKRAACPTSIGDPAVRKSPTTPMDPVICPYCPSQYSSHAKMVNHLSLKHTDKMADYNEKRKNFATKKKMNKPSKSDETAYNNEYANQSETQLNDVSYLDHDILEHVDSTMAPTNQYIVGRQISEMHSMTHLVDVTSNQPDYLRPNVSVTMPTSYENNQFMAAMTTTDDVVNNVTTDILSDFETVGGGLNSNPNDNYRVLNNQQNMRPLPMTYQRGRKQLLLQAMNEERDRDNRIARGYQCVEPPHPRGTHQSQSNIIPNDDITMDINRTNNDYLHDNHLHNQNDTSLTQLTTANGGWVCPSYVIISSDKQKNDH